jgi:hypothetical protein
MVVKWHRICHTEDLGSNLDQVFRDDEEIPFCKIDLIKFILI